MQCYYYKLAQVRIVGKSIECNYYKLCALPHLKGTKMVDWRALGMSRVLLLQVGLCWARLSWVGLGWIGLS